MRNWLLAAALLGASMVPPSSPAVAKGSPPPPTPVDCQLDISGRMQCAYVTRDECRAGIRYFRRNGHPEASGCWLSTADPDWWHYGKYVLEYWP